ncbi:plasmid mobilization protein (plasmid) [Methylomonas sp. 2BW1-5-20]|uniref:plasmid mobilization protein n=1 Tax=Methylomonas sp. 2BW1-5-20 TaxID=3376686 RepID=UPI00405241CF
MSASDNRQRSPLTVQLNADERAKVQADAEAVGLSLSGYARTLLLGRQTEGTKRRAARDAVELARLSGQVGKVGGNLNQLTKLANQGQLIPPPALAACLAEVREILERLDEALSGDS